MNEATQSLPWSEPPALPEKPAGMDYGYVTVEKGKQAVLHEATLEDVKKQVASGDAVEVVMPGLDRIAPPSIVEELWPAVQLRDKDRRARERQNAFFNVLLFGGITIYALKRENNGSQMIFLIFVLFGVVPLIQYVVGAIRRKIYGSDTFEETRERTMFAFWLGAVRTPTTFWGFRALIALFAIQVLTSAIAAGGWGFFNYLIQNIFNLPPETIDAAALVKPLDGQYWRLLTCGLVHGNLLHIFFNGMALKSVGQVLERFYGGRMLLLTFFLSVLGGSIASTVLMPKTISVGASGGILGLVGFLLIVGLRHRKSLPADFAKSIIRSVIFMAALGYFARNYINNAAHAGGFLVGCLIALPLGKNVREIGDYKPAPWVRWGSLVAEYFLWMTAILVIIRLAKASGLF